MVCWLSHCATYPYVLKLGRASLLCMKLPECAVSTAAVLAADVATLLLAVVAQPAAAAIAAALWPGGDRCL